MGKYIMSFAVQLIILTVLSFGIHYLILEVFEMKSLWTEGYYSLLQIYFFLLLVTLAMTAAMVFIAKAMPQNIGYAFLVLLTLKLVANYLFIQPVLDSEVDLEFIKHNYLIVFLLFLGFDVFVTYRLLNNKN